MFTQVEAAASAEPLVDGVTGARPAKRLRIPAIASMPAGLRVAIREPLVHFLVAGGMLLALSALFGRSPAFGGAQNRIQVTAATIQRLRETWTAQWGQPPASAKLQTLIDEFVREEILYREAIASGLDREDTIIRRHLAQKVEFLAQGVAAATEPSEAELRQFFEQHKASYLIPPKIAFTHVYFSTSRRGASASQAARDALERLAYTRTSAQEASALGDSFMLQYEYPLKTRDEIRELFGGDFANALFTMTPGGWTGPVSSSYGVHLVRIDQHVMARAPDLDEVRGQVTTDFNDQRVRSAVDAYYQRLRERYRVDVDEQALGAR